MKKQQGFTLIELVVVIIILGILAVVAAPKFINLQGDARASTLKGMEAAIQGANTLVYSKASLAGDEKAAKDKKVTVANKDVNLAYGYIKADAADIQNAVDANAADWTITGTGPVVITQVGAPAATGDGDTLKACQLTYTAPTAPGNQPTYTIVDNGC
ncbi:prepilin-type N-terminal cleavage/methylation domain-containing protein [Shewanella marina]|uniref:prepilin-type N-terminal cleavage/methylation domain-containing protein n=1 Tax=Shewanella marina TaxID=487319 RepID=UPI00047257FD|nr:prepilin-type N-terminal cleavage/methylation domain-containing protein [Shewanella marina]